MKKLSIQDAKQIDIVDYLASLGFNPSRIRGSDYWYHSPLRIENTPSFKVNCKANIWYDHGTGKGGSIIDFGILYHHCSIRDLLTRFNNFCPGMNVSFQQQYRKADLFLSPAVENKDSTKGKITIVSERSLSSNILLLYIETRQIPKHIATHYCKEVDFMLYEKQHTAIGFRNDQGGYELRNSYFKGSSSPKTSSFIDQHCQCVDVFEGFFNFLSAQAVNENKKANPNNFLILNSLAFFQQQRIIMERHELINLYLDRDKAGMECTASALKINSKYKDQSAIYSNHKDLNDWLVQRKENEPQLIKHEPKKYSKHIKL